MPIIHLIDYSKNPFDISIASARTCYSSKGVVFPEEVSKDERSKLIRDKIAKATLEAGHLTTRQHPQFIFAIDKITRAAVWSFLHSHPFYNSEQVSQRYVEVQPDQFYYPPSLYKKEKLYEIYKECILFQSHSYYELKKILIPIIEKEYFSIFPYRKKKKEQWQKGIERKAMEIARYVLPLATYTYLYHTISGLTLYRYKKIIEVSDVPEEISELVQSMWNCVYQIDTLYASEIKDSISIYDTPEYKIFSEFFDASKNQSSEFVEYFDQTLQGYSSRLVSYTSNAKQVILDSFYSVFGMIPSGQQEKRIFELLFHPKHNIYLGSTLNESMHTKLNRIFYHLHFTFQKKLSHTADSQDQRHRMVPASRPFLMNQYTGKPDYIIPKIVQEYSDLEESYKKIMHQIFDLINQFLNEGATKEEAMYLLPNAFPVRYFESGDLLNLIHKWKMRTCYNAQEEIFYASIQEIQQVEEKLPFLKGFFRAPCYIRKLSGYRPYCPEGERFCGLRIWEYELNQYYRLI